jgi:hypothetical protein
MNGDSASAAVLIVVANEPRMLREMLVCVLATSPEMVVVEQQGERLLRSAVLRQERVDWVIITANQAGILPPQAKLLLERLPTLSLLTISLDGSQVTTWVRTDHQAVQHRVYHDLSLAQLKAILTYRWQI